MVVSHYSEILPQVTLAAGPALSVGPSSDNWQLPSSDPVSLQSTVLITVA